MFHYDHHKEVYHFLCGHHKHTYKPTYIHTCIYIHTYMHIHTFKHTFIYTYCRYIYTCTYIHTYVFIYIFVCIYVSTYIYIHTCIHILYMHTSLFNQDLKPKQQHLNCCSAYTVHRKYHIILNSFNNSYTHYLLMMIVQYVVLVVVSRAV
jgi:hypothetical protein